MHLSLGLLETCCVILGLLLLFFLAEAEPPQELNSRVDSLRRQLLAELRWSREARGIFLTCEQLGVLLVDLLVHDSDAVARLLVRDEKVLLLPPALPGALA